jgi:TetR/AcrR family transcriptional regulator, regulator of cefoperazone and chloramphenicol sensitivity
MRSAPADLTARALIRNAALRLFAELGPDRVSLRRIAAEAGVSHGLVVHHFGSKEGLRTVVDTYVVDLFDELVAEMAGTGGAEAADPFSAQARESLVGALMERLPPDSPIPSYLRRVLLDGGEAGRVLFGRLYALTRGTLDAMAQNGYADRGKDPNVRAAFLLANDLAMFLLRDQITLTTGVDPLSPEGIRSWGEEVFTVYSYGLREHGDSRNGQDGESRS